MIITVDTTTDDTVAASLAGLDSEVRYRIQRALREIDTSSSESVIVTSIREALPSDRPVVGVLFSTLEWDNGHYLTSRGEVLFDDGHSEEFDFEELDDVLTDEYGCQGADFTLAVDMRTGSLDADDYGNPDIRARFNYTA